MVGEAKKLLVILTIAGIVMNICGCEEKNEEGTSFDNIYFDGGGIFKLVNASLTFTTNKSEEIVAATVTMLFQNIADRMVSANVSVVFYDENNVELYREYRKFVNYPPGYMDQFVAPANMVTFEGEDAGKVDHVMITVREMQE